MSYDVDSLVSVVLVVVVVLFCLSICRGLCVIESVLEGLV